MASCFPLGFFFCQKRVRRGTFRTRGPWAREPIGKPWTTEHVALERQSFLKTDPEDYHSGETIVDVVTKNVHHHGDQIAGSGTSTHLTRGLFMPKQW